MGINERKARQKAQLIENILRAAEELFVEEGFENVSLRKLAEKIEYSHTAIYKHFDSKMHIMLEIMQRGQGELRKKFEEAKEREFAGPREKMRELLKIFLCFGLEHPNHFRLWLHYSQPSRKGPSLNLSTPVKEFRAFESWFEALEQCRKAGLLRHEDLELAFQLIWASIHGLISLLVTYPQFPWRPHSQLIEEMLDGVLRAHFTDEESNLEKSK